MTYDIAALKSAHPHGANHKREVEISQVCGCFYCCATYPTAQIAEWLEDLDGTALCPRCGIDSVIGSASGYPVADETFLRAMHRFWFS